MLWLSTCHVQYMYLLAQVLYSAALVGMSLYQLSDEDHLPCYRLVAYFSMIHVAVWATVGMFDRLIRLRVQCTCRYTSIPYGSCSRGCKPQWYCALYIYVYMYMCSSTLFCDINEVSMCVGLYSGDIRCCGGRAISNSTAKWEMFVEFHSSLSPLVRQHAVEITLSSYM